MLLEEQLEIEIYQKEIIEKVFDEIKYIQTLDLSGGEVFLGYEQLKNTIRNS